MKKKLLLTVFVIIQLFHTNKKMTLYIKKMTVDPKPVFLGLSKLFGSSEEKSRQPCCALEQHGCFEPLTARGDLFSTSPLLYTRSRRCLWKYRFFFSPSSSLCDSVSINKRGVELICLAK